MGFFSFLNPILDGILLPVLKLGPLWFLVIISLIVSWLITLIYKYTTDQNLMKTLKEELKVLQKEMKELKDHPEKIKEVQSKFSQTNMKFMMESMKPTLYYMIPLIILFGWLGSHLAYEPILPGQEFSIEVLVDDYGGNISINVPKGIELTSENVKKIENKLSIFTMKGEEGEYLFEFNADNKIFNVEVVVSPKKYTDPIKKFNNELIKEIRASNKKLIVLNLFGWKIGWLGTYIIFSIVLGSLLRKLMKVY